MLLPPEPPPDPSAPEPPDPEDSAAAPGTHQPWWRRPRWLLVGGAGLAAVALVVAVAVPPQSQPEPESELEPVRVVREFFAALREQHLEQALEIAGVDLPSGDEAYFLHPFAMSDQWEVRDITPPDHLHDTDGYAHVTVTIAGPDGSTLRSDIRTEADQDGQWTIPSPFATVAFARSPLWFADVNGWRAPTDPEDYNMEYLLWPGFYRFYPQLRGFDAGVGDRLVMPGMVEVVVPQVTIDESGQAAVQLAVERYIRSCTTSDALLPHACPFGVEFYSELPGFSIGWDSDDRARWLLNDQPVVAATPDDNYFRLADRARGTINLRATVESVDRHGESTQDPPAVGSRPTVTCEIDTSQLVAGVAATGEVSIAMGIRGYAYPDQERGTTRTAPTCTNAILAEE